MKKLKGPFIEYNTLEINYLKELLQLKKKGKQKTVYFEIFKLKTKRNGRRKKKLAGV